MTICGAREYHFKKGSRAEWPNGIPPKGTRLHYQKQIVTSDGELFIAGMLLVRDENGVQFGVFPSELRLVEESQP